MGWNDVNFSSRRSQPFDWFNPNPVTPFDDVVFGDDEEEEEQEPAANMSTGPSTYIQRMNEVMAQDQPAMRRYLENMAAQPNREDYKPNNWTKLAAVLAGVSGGIQGGAGTGIRNAMETRMLPWHQAYEDWSTRQEGLGAAAKMEQTKLTQLLDDLQKMEDARVKNENAITGRMGAESRRSTADTYRKMVETPNYDFGSDADSSFLYDSKSGQRINVGKSSAAAQRALTESEGSKNRTNALTLADKNNRAAWDRNYFTTVNRPRTTTYRTVGAADIDYAKRQIMAEVMADPDLAKQYEQFLEEDNNTNLKTLPFEAYRLKPPSAANPRAKAAYDAFVSMIEKQALERNSIQIPASIQR